MLPDFVANTPEAFTTIFRNLLRALRKHITGTPETPCGDLQRRFARASGNTSPDLLEYDTVIPETRCRDRRQPLLFVLVEPKKRNCENLLDRIKNFRFLELSGPS